jgi:FixJ family two-component response regulator
MPSGTTEIAVVHLVDDDASLRAAMASLFESVGLATRAYGTARDFLTAPVTDMPGCVVIDVRLPDMNGLEFQAQLTQSGVHLPVVMITGYGDIPMSVRAMKHGAVDFLSKPFRDRTCLMPSSPPSSATGPDGRRMGTSRVRANGSRPCPRASSR